jgi:hypothetical protein
VTALRLREAVRPLFDHANSEAAWREWCALNYRRGFGGDLPILTGRLVTWTAAARGTVLLLSARTPFSSDELNRLSFLNVQLREQVLIRLRAGEWRTEGLSAEGNPVEQMQAWWARHSVADSLDIWSETVRQGGVEFSHLVVYLTALAPAAAVSIPAEARQVAAAIEAGQPKIRMTQRDANRAMEAYAQRWLAEHKGDKLPRPDGMAHLQAQHASWRVANAAYKALPLTLKQTVGKQE